MEMGFAKFYQAGIEEIGWIGRLPVVMSLKRSMQYSSHAVVIRVVMGL